MAKELIFESCFVALPSGSCHKTDDEKDTEQQYKKNDNFKMNEEEVNLSLMAVDCMKTLK